MATIMDRFQREEVVARLASSAIYRRLLGEEREAQSHQRKATIDEAKRNAAEDDARLKSASAALVTARDANSKAVAAADRAREALRNAELEMRSAECGADKRRSRATAQLLESADPRIDALRDHLERLHEAARDACRPVTERYALALVGGARLVREWNVSAVSEARASLRALCDELQDLKVSDYGADPIERLKDVHARAIAACAPLKLQEVAQIPPHVIEE